MNVNNGINPDSRETPLEDTDFDFEDLQVFPGVFAEGRAAIRTQEMDGIWNWWIEKVTFSYTDREGKTAWESFRIGSPIFERLEKQLLTQQSDKIAAACEVST